MMTFNRKFLPAIACLIALMGLSACSETRYAAHVAKQFPMPGDRAAQTKGTFKVGNAYNIQGKRYYPAETYNLTESSVVLPLL